MHISFAVFADAANLSQEGKLNVLGVFDAVQVAGLPTIHPRTHFIVRLKANGDAMQVTLDDQPTAAARLFVNGPAAGSPMIQGAPNGMVS